ncbi:hypothetical protein [Sinorhizobium meliloti]|uniref:hypothetical protein n=1 Tax=Rhizobium meliloti TaxID=382 RepID=UPI000B4A26AB|nr:hypothetical protein [Sinorhizobium meliloti]ASP86735.1 hypothetical protein CDO26_19250 [Sinorhizobium meliloti]MQW26516.1 hypothetical protein [Sinorhizobium meliloti]RVJ68657.1 hypothetical protein CN171_25150 [Sinorhizobium meliloti]RVJ86081.1 hypothetical protein CN169_28700 [Sinorhizobium meliloti]
MLQSHDHTGAILPADVNMIAAVFTEILTDKGLRRDCEAAELIARRLISVYKSGHRERGELRKMATDDRPAPRRGHFGS